MAVGPTAVCTYIVLKQTIGKNSSNPGATVYDVASERLCWGISEGTAAFPH